EQEAAQQAQREQEAAQKAQQEQEEAQQAQREQEAAQKSQQEQVVKETFSQIQSEEDLFEAEDRVSQASEVENRQARSESLADTSQIRNHSNIETGQARSKNLAESELLGDGKSLSLAPGDERSEANTANLSNLVRLEQLSTEEIEKQKYIKTAETSGGPKSQSTLPILHVFDKPHLADIGEEEDNNVSDTESFMSVVDDQPHIEERGNSEDGQSKKELLPKEIEDIRAKMGGRDGPLFAYVNAKLNGIEDKEAAKVLKSLGDEIDKFCDTRDINRATYALTNTHINAFYQMIGGALDGLKLLKADPNNTNAYNQFNLLRSAAELFIRQHQWPEDFLDTFVPSDTEVTKLVNVEIAKEQKAAALKAQEEAAQDAVQKSQPEQGALRKAQQEQEAAQQAQQEQEAAQQEQEQEAARKVQQEQEKIQITQREKETVENSKFQEGQTFDRIQTSLLDKGQQNHQSHLSNIRKQAERPALLENDRTQNNYTTPESDQAQTEVQGQRAGTTSKPQLRQLDPVAKDKATVQFEEQHTSFQSEYVPMAHKRSFGEMQTGRGAATWKYSSKAQRRKQALIRVTELIQGNHDGDSEESVVPKKLKTEEYQRRLEREKEEQKERNEQKEIKEQKEREEQKEKEEQRKKQEEVFRRAGFPV
ncbi:hypothetical protein V497_00302, partial [Pseudogymnoascus sp. VKM F-4516 (FW-969)]